MLAQDRARFSDASDRHSIHEMDPISLCVDR
jgi:hypothetical protein